MKYILIALSLFVHDLGFSQASFEKVNRKDVEMLVTDSLTPTYYPKLLDRFLNDDSTLSGIEYRLLYYGFVFQNEYSGYPDLKQKEINEAVNKKKYDLVLRLCDSVLSKYPINLFANYNKSLAVFMTNKEDPDFVKYRNRYANIIRAIASSGDGLSCSTAFKTIFVNDEYQMMYNYFEIQNFKGQSLQTPCDRMSVSPSKYFKSDYMYFDTSETLLYMQKLFEKNKD